MTTAGNETLLCKSKVRTGQFVECAGGQCALHQWGLFKPRSLKDPPVLQHRTFPSWLSCDGKECVLSD